MEMTSNENLHNSTNSSNDVHHDNNMVPDVLNHGTTTKEHEIVEEEIRGILEVIASSGKFWHDWDKLKSILSFQMKQVLSEYPEAKMTSEQQITSFGEMFPELVKRLDEALHSFIEGPPFTLQRLCEILLDAQGIYPNLSKLALALEKNLSVTSMLSISADPYPQTMMQESNEPDKANEEQKLHSNSVENGVEAVGDRDEVMTEVREADVVDDDMTIDMEAFQDIVGGSSETNTVPASQ
ncbi:hypothetical protein FNV43_RR23781 [Rhamnella rubrinervis]|uniref:Serine/threonine-protein phosphatase 4 regulatory subunit 2 n=1 Tax=Rhamnella rubrinervis TaxID=2594499 RepID=A0A8K0DR86_9ROSA|nr:hypothetical protein FNV43_RR23781 [Rhamnella rubrinervis]